MFIVFHIIVFLFSYFWSGTFPVFFLLVTFLPFFKSSGTYWSKNVFLHRSITWSIVPKMFNSKDCKQKKRKEKKRKIIFHLKKTRINLLLSAFSFLNRPSLGKKRKMKAALSNDATKSKPFTATSNLKYLFFIKRVIYRVDNVPGNKTFVRFISKTAKKDGSAICKFWTWNKSAIKVLISVQ